MDYQTSKSVVLYKLSLISELPEEKVMQLALLEEWSLHYWDSGFKLMYCGDDRHLFGDPK